eukprot:1674614-Pyramimonas_sp.AAC.1
MLVATACQRKKERPRNLYCAGLRTTRDCGSWYGETTMAILSVSVVVASQHEMIASSIRNFPRGLSTSASATLSTNTSY